MNVGKAEIFSIYLGSEPTPTAPLDGWNQCRYAHNYFASAIVFVIAVSKLTLWLWDTKLKTLNFL